MEPETTSPRKRKASQDAEGDEAHADHRHPSPTSSGAISIPSTTTTAISIPITEISVPAAPVSVAESAPTSDSEDTTSFSTTLAQNTLAELSQPSIAQYPSTSISQVDRSQAERDMSQDGTSSQQTADAARSPAVETNTGGTGTAQQRTLVPQNIGSFQLPDNDIVQRVAEFIDILDGDEENTDTEAHPVIVLDDDDDDNDDDEDDDDELHHPSTQDTEDGADSSGGDSDVSDQWRHWLRQRELRYLDAQHHESAIVVEDDDHDHDQDMDEELALNAPGRRYVTTISSRSPSRRRSESADPVQRNSRRRNRPYRRIELPSSPFQQWANSRSPDVVISDDDEDQGLPAAGTSAGHAAAAAAAAAAASSSSSSHQMNHRQRRPSAGSIFPFNVMSDNNDSARDDDFLSMNQILREATEARERRRAEAAATAIATRTAIPAHTPPPRTLPVSISSMMPSALPSSSSSSSSVVASAIPAPSANTVAPPAAAAAITAITETPVTSEATQMTSRITERLRCSICLELPTAPTITRCGHLFCRSCITQAQVLGMGRKCPVCRTPLTANRLQSMVFETSAPAPTLVE